MKMKLPQFRSSTSETTIELPKSKYGIRYSYGGSTSSQRQKRVPQFLRSGNKKPSKMSPFGCMIQSLNEVTQRDGHSVGTALMYIREIFEPGDPEFDYIGDNVSARQLSKEQVDRLRIMILPWRREAKIVTYLNRISAVASTSQSQVNLGSTGILTEFEAFQRHYFCIRSPQKKLDELFGFSFGLKVRSDWIFEYESNGIREHIMANLARHWRNLMRLHSPQQLGLDEEFSLPALIEFLDKFKQLCDSIETFGPPIRFVYKHTSKAKSVQFQSNDIETVSSLSHMSSDSVSLSNATMLNARGNR